MFLVKTLEVIPMRVGRLCGTGRVKELAVTQDDNDIPPAIDDSDGLTLVALNWTGSHIPAGSLCLADELGNNHSGAEVALLAMDVSGVPVDWTVDAPG